MGCSCASRTKAEQTVAENNADRIPVQPYSQKAIMARKAKPARDSDLSLGVEHVSDKNKELFSNPPAVVQVQPYGLEAITSRKAARDRDMSLEAKQTPDEEPDGDKEVFESLEPTAVQPCTTETLEKEHAVEVGLHPTLLGALVNANPDLATLCETLAVEECMTNNFEKKNVVVEESTENAGDNQDFDLMGEGKFATFAEAALDGFVVGPCKSVNSKKDDAVVKRKLKRSAFDNEHFQELIAEAERLEDAEIASRVRSAIVGAEIEAVNEDRKVRMRHLDNLVRFDKEVRVERARICDEETLANDDADDEDDGECMMAPSRALSDQLEDAKRKRDARGLSNLEQMIEELRPDSK